MLSATAPCCVWNYIARMARILTCAMLTSHYENKLSLGMIMMMNVITITTTTTIIIVMIAAMLMAVLVVTMIIGITITTSMITNNEVYSSVSNSSSLVRVMTQTTGHRLNQWGRRSVTHICVPGPYQQQKINEIFSIYNVQDSMKKNNNSWMDLQVIWLNSTLYTLFIDNRGFSCTNMD